MNNDVFMKKIVNKKAQILLQRYFEDISPLNSNINSFNDFLDRMLSVIIEENK